MEQKKYLDLDGLKHYNDKLKEVFAPLKDPIDDATIHITTYNELKSLRDNATLIPGHWYRITDYQCYTSQENTRSANHPFDILVMALSENTLSEDARAMMHDGDTYYEHANITTWKLKYTLDDPEQKYSWGIVTEEEQIPIINNFLYDSSNCSIKSELITDNTFNEPVPIKYILTIDAENNEFYDSTKIESDLFIEWGYEQEPRMDIPSLCIYKTDIEGLGDEPNPEFAYADTYDKFFYRGKEEVDGVVYDKWQKFETNDSICEDIRDGYNSQMYFILTPEIVNGEVQITELPTFKIKSEITIRIDEEHIDNNYNSQFTFFAGAKRLDNNDEQHLVIYPNVQRSEGEITNYASLLDYENPFFYCGQEEVDGVVYDKWRKINTVLTWEHYYEIYTLTPVIVEDGEISMELVHATHDIQFPTIESHGIIYQLIDDRGNECPYDFKNIQYLLDGQWYFTFDYEGLDTSIQKYNVENNDGYIFKCGNNIIKPCNMDHELYGLEVWALNNIVFKYAMGSCSNTFGINCHYNTFGNNCHHNTFGDDCFENSFGNNCYSNTFGSDCGDNTFGNNCHHNIFGNNCYSNTFGNNFNINTFRNNCHHNTFRIGCNSNTFGEGCYYNTFGDGCYSNTFENNCYSNTFGNKCYSNTFENDCYKNTFENDCYKNTFENNCYKNTFKNNHSNTFGNNCQSNTFGNNCQSNTFGNYCSLNTFGNNFNINTFGNNCHHNTFGVFCNNNTFGNDCHHNTFNKNNINDVEVACYYNTFGNECYENNFGYNCCHNTFGNECYLNTFGNNCWCNTFGELCNYNTFGKNCNNNIFGNNCQSNTFGNNCHYNTFEDNCYRLDFTALQSVLRSKFSRSTWYINFDVGTNASTAVAQNIFVGPGIYGKNNNNRLAIDIEVSDNDYEWRIMKNSKGEIKQYCEADLIF